MPNSYDDFNSLGIQFFAFNPDGLDFVGYFDVVRERYLGGCWCEVAYDAYLSFLYFNDDWFWNADVLEWRFGRKIHVGCDGGEVQLFQEGGQSLGVEIELVIA